MLTTWTIASKATKSTSKQTLIFSHTLDRAGWTNLMLYKGFQSKIFSNCTFAYKTKLAWLHTHLRKLIVEMVYADVDSCNAHCASSPAPYPVAASPAPHAHAGPAMSMWAQSTCSVIRWFSVHNITISKVGAQCSLPCLFSWRLWSSNFKRSTRHETMTVLLQRNTTVLQNLIMYSSDEYHKVGFSHAELVDVSNALAKCQRTKSWAMFGS